jgi:hypothetical protein
MTQYLKINSQLINADTIIFATPSSNNEPNTEIITKQSVLLGDAGKTLTNYWLLQTGSTDERDALVIAINKALTAKPGGRVLEVPASSNYTISSIEYNKGF